MNEKKFTIFGVEQLPLEVYYACTFEGLGSRKDEFLERAVRAMEAKGFKKVPPIEPFRLSLGLKDGLKFWDWRWRGKAYLYQLIGADVQLESQRKGTKYYMALRAKTRNENLRFGYAYGRKIDLKSVSGIFPILQLVTITAYMFVAGFFTMKSIVIGLGQSPWAWTIAILITSLVIAPPFIAFLIYHFITKPKRLLKEANRIFTEIAESMDGKQIAPFKRTTFKLED